MRNEYNIDKLNSRKNPYVRQLVGRDSKSVVEETKHGVNKAIVYEKGNQKEISRTDNSDKGDLIDLLHENRG